MKNLMNDLLCVKVYCANPADWDCQETSDFELLKSNDFVCFEDFQFFDSGFNPRNSMISWLSMQQKECSYCRSDINSTNKSIDGPNETIKSYSMPSQQSYSNSMPSLQSCSSNESDSFSGVNKPAESESNQKTDADQIGSESQSQDDLNSNSTQSTADSQEEQSPDEDPFLPDPTNDNINQANGFLPNEICLFIILMFI